MTDNVEITAAEAGDRLEAVPDFVTLLESVAGSVNAHPELTKHLTDAIAVIANDDGADRPFLSVLLRTQGQRIEPLKDALLCLSAQTDQDFEVVVLEHDALPENSADIATVISRLPPSFASKVKLIRVVGGTRAKPLNAGLDAAKGRYVAVYDDDDLLFANWVEEFRRAAEHSKGRLLRGVVANQKVEPELWPSDQDGFRTLSWPKAEYPAKFSQLNHLVVNHSPFMSWAFPRTLFSIFGLRFDEELTVCEDWDVILRGSLLCGVEDIPALTAIYRRWEGGDSSYSRHSVDAWRLSEQRVIDRINQTVLTLPPGAMHELRGILLYNDALGSYKFLFKGNTLREPIHLVWKMASPGVRLAVRVRNKLRRMSRR